MKKWLLLIAAAAFLTGLATIFLWKYFAQEEQQQLHFERGETEVIFSNPTRAKLEIFRAGNHLSEATPVEASERSWLQGGNYFAKVEMGSVPYFFPIPLLGYRSGPDKEGTFIVTVRAIAKAKPPGLTNSSDFAFIPGGSFLMGDRKNPQDPHHVWLTGFFMSRFETTNDEFRLFMSDPKGYANDGNWTQAGRIWKSKNSSRVSALLKPVDTEYLRFGQADQPVTNINWFEASAFCKWMTQKLGKSQWIFSLPTEAEWEKAARGPDNFDYGLSMNLSDQEVKLYNWKKNPSAEVTVVGVDESRSQYGSNRYGIYHMSGNVTEWTQSVHRPLSKEHPYQDDDRNHDETNGVRVARGGSWYSASNALLYLPYRDTFQPDLSNHDLGFRIVCHVVP